MASPMSRAGRILCRAGKRKTERQQAHRGFVLPVREDFVSALPEGMAENRASWDLEECPESSRFCPGTKGSCNESSGGTEKVPRVWEPAGQHHEQKDGGVGGVWFAVSWQLDWEEEEVCAVHG